MAALKELYDIFCSNPVITTDSRQVPEGSIFFAIRGPNFDGNDYAAAALEKGAAFAVVEKSLKYNHARILKVDDTLSTLQQLANHHRKVLGTKILAITGSNGKTTTKELSKAVLSKNYNVFATSGNLNNHIGVPLSLLSLKRNTHIGIIEMGANHPGEIATLCKIALPDFGLITNIGKAHLEGFGGIEGVASAKGELFVHLALNDKTLFVNEGNEYVRSIVPVDYSNYVGYNNNNFNGELISCDPFLRVKAKIYTEEMVVNTNLVGKYNIENVVAATAIGNFFNVPASDIKEAIEAYVPDNFRSQFINTGKNRVIMDAYNANPSSMISAIENFLGTESDNKLLILGEMLELGEVSKEEHKKIVNFLQKENTGDVIFIGTAFSQLISGKQYRCYPSADDFLKNINPGEITSKFILIKGSRGNKLEKIMSVL